MKQSKVLIFTLIIITALIIITSIGKQNASQANISELPSWSVTVHYEFGSGLVPGAAVHIKLNGTGSDLFGSPHNTNSSGFTWFENNGSAFPNGSYEVRAVKFGYGDGVTTVVISNGAPVYPITNVNIGTPE